MFFQELSFRLKFLSDEGEKSSTQKTSEIRIAVDD